MANASVLVGVGSGGSDGSVGVEGDGDGELGRVGDGGVALAVGVPSPRRPASASATSQPVDHPTMPSTTSVAANAVIVAGLNLSLTQGRVMGPYEANSLCSPAPDRVRGMPPSRMIRALTTAAGVAAGVGAAQLGIGYGLGVFSWLPTVHGVDEAAWLASLAWTVWISALSVVIGAVVADRSSLPTVGMSPIARILWRAVLALAAALGGLIVVALTAVPSRVAQRADTFAPHLIVGGYAIAGVLLGLFVAIAAVNARPIATNILITSGWMWLLAAVATVDALAADGELEVAQLGVWQITSDGPWFHSIYVPGAALAGGSAVIIGALTAWPAAVRRAGATVVSEAGSRIGSGWVAVALSGAAGPAIVAAAYLLAAPVLVSVSPQQLSAHLVAPYAVLAGLCGSVAVALLTGSRHMSGNREDDASPAASAP